MTTLHQLINRHHIRAVAEYGAPENPEFVNSDGYTVTLRRGRKRMSIHFYMGPALAREPNAKDVLSCVLSDSSGLESTRSFEEWCADYGYDTDSRRAERIYKQVRRQDVKLRRFLDGVYGEFAAAELP